MNRDGSQDNESWNCGIEGPTSHPEVNALRARQQRNFLATLLLSQGVPMLQAGDEFGRTQQGNNNAYCQDSPLAWLHWDLTREQQDLLDFTCSLTRLRQSHPVFRRRRFFQGRPIYGAGVKDLHWIKSDGTEMSDLDWQASHVACLGMVLPGNQIDETNDQGDRIRDDSFAILFNAHHETVPFRLGTQKYHLRWICELDTALPLSAPRRFDPMSVFPLQPRSLVILRAESLPPTEVVAFS